MPETGGTRGLVLAAGFGSRLAPITEHVPKPLLPLGGGTLLDHAIGALRRGGIGPIAVNSHHLGALVEGHLAARPDAETFLLCPEPRILGTGGPLAAARDFLEQGEDFVVFNGDVLCDVDVAQLVRAHRRGGRLATLLVVDRPRINSVFVDEGDRVVHIRGAGPQVPATALITARGLTYTGVGVFARRFLARVPAGFGSLITPLVGALEEDPGCVGVYRPEGLFWDDLGTLTRYLQARWLLEQEPDRFAWLAEGLVGEGASPLGPAGPLRCARLRGHGSDRRFYRLTADDWSAVAMQSDAGREQDDEFRRHLAVGAFLREQDLGPAEVLSRDVEGRTALMEDLGEDTLYRRACAGDDLRPLYRQTVDHLLKLQDATDAARQACPAATDRRLGLEDLRWETSYFRERFLLGVHGREPDLETLFADLARRVARQPLVLLHRDFQSQNIHLRSGRVRLVDFQGMRLGPVGYDLMSLVWDPYVPLPMALRRELMDHFLEHREQATEGMLLEAGLQRLMQALGAYGYLGLVKGKQEFLAHIPAGVQNLHHLLLRTGEQSAPPRGLAALVAVVEEILKRYDGYRRPR